MSAAETSRRILATASLWCFRSVQRARRDRLRAALAAPSGPSEAAGWVPLSRWLAASPDRILLKLLSGPRWNCGAVLALTPPLEVRERLSVSSDDASRACEHWTVVVYDEQLRTVGALGSLQDAPHTLTLAPGRYSLAVRYYEPRPDAHFPTIVADEGIAVSREPVGDEPNAYQRTLRDLRTRRRWLYLAMHYHAYAMLRDPDTYPADEVRRRFLPVGNPETIFSYGYVRRGDELWVEPAPIVGSRIYVAVYGKDSIPLAWASLGERGGRVSAARETGTYVVRWVLPRGEHLAPPLRVERRRATRRSGVAHRYPPQTARDGG